MLGVVVLCAFSACGILQAMRVFERHAAIVRVWLGMVMGLMEMMWFPCLYAYIFCFTQTAQLYALSTSLLLALLCALWPRKHTTLRVVREKPISVRFALLLVLPAAVLGGYLQYTHMLCEMDGALYAGQSTWGDLCMHVSFATGLIGQSFPPEYTLLPGTSLGYPFLVDALSATMLIFDTPISMAFYVPGTLMTALIDLGFVLFAWKLTHKKGATVLAFVLFVCNGGLGFLQTGLDEAAIQNALHGFYQTPTNMPELNLRWVNFLCDLIIPQRALMAGWMCVLPALYLLLSAIRSGRMKDFVAVGLWAGPMVMIHTHTFLALGVISLGAMADCVIRSQKGKRLKTFMHFCVYGLIACALALPQLLQWTFPQTVNGGSLRLLFNWVNNAGNGRLIDGYLVFWIKNVGLVYVFVFIAGLAAKKPSARALSLGCLLLYLLAENVLFQPNVYDNNKLFTVAFMAMLPLAAQLLCEIYARMKGIRGRIILAVLFVTVSVVSGGITIARECVSGTKGDNYQLFSKSNVEAAEFIKENTPKDALFLTASNHNNTVATLAGRKIVCGSSLYLYYHGLDYRQNEAEAALMLAYPQEYEELFEKYGVNYIFVSSYENSPTYIDGQYITDPSLMRNTYSVNETKIAEMYPLVFECGEWYDRIHIYEVTKKTSI